MEKWHTSLARCNASWIASVEIMPVDMPRQQPSMVFKLLPNEKKINCTTTEPFQTAPIWNDTKTGDKQTSEYGYQGLLMITI